MATAAPSHALAPRLYGGCMAVLALMGLAGWLAAYPLGPWLAGGLLAIYVILLLVQPSLWLVLLPGLWPVVDLAPWTGQIHVNESDALLLATLAGLGLREGLAPPVPTLRGGAPARLGLGGLGGFGLLALAVGVAAVRGLLPLPALDAGSLVGYATPLNSLRVAKGYVLAFALIPFLHLAVRRDGDLALGRFAAGMTLGLGSCALAALWERMAFPGLTNFSADYRSAGLFWEMHVGGAALDAWLSLSFPFALAHLRMARSQSARLGALLLVALGSYALFTTFSRIVYASVLISGAIIGVMAWRHPVHRDEAVPRSHGGVLVLLAAAAAAGCALCFHSGGYRGMAAFAGWGFLIYAGGGLLRAGPGGAVVGGLISGLLVGGLTAVVGWWLPKGVYLVYGVSWVVAAAILGGGLLGRVHTPPALAAALLAWVGVNTASICAFWGDMAGLPGVFLALGLGAAALAGQVVAARPLWHAKPDDLYVVTGLLGASGIVVATLASAYMGDRLANTRNDANDRRNHFLQSAALVHDPVGRLFGLGLGRYPDSYFWNVPDPGVPGFLALRGGPEGRYLQMGGERRAVGFGENLRLLQRLPSDVQGPFLMRARLRTSAEASFSLAVCRKHLLYPEDCSEVTRTVKGGGAWQEVEVKLDGAGFRPAGWPPRPAVLVLTVLGREPLDLDGLEFSDGRLRSLLRNGDFEQGMDFWFFSSDHDHLPWHAKNLFLQTYVEQGVLGLVALLAVLGGAVVHLLRQPARGHPMAPILLASLAGITTVGMVDSLVDMPRITLMLLLVLWLGASLRKAPDGSPRR